MEGWKAHSPEKFGLRIALLGFSLGNFRPRFAQEPLINFDYHKLQTLLNIKYL